MGFGLFLSKTLARVPYVVPKAARNKYDGEMAKRRVELARDPKLPAKEYAKARTSLIEQFGTGDASHAAVQRCPKAPVAVVAAKAQRRRARKELIARAGQAAADRHDPAGVAAAARLARDMDAIEKGRLAKHVYLKYDSDEDGKMPDDLKALKESAPVGFKPATTEDLATLGLTPEDLAPGSMNFRAAVYKYDPAVWGPEYEGKFVVAVRGTTRNLQDWENNFQNGGGKDSEYYRQAKSIGDKIRTAKMSDKVEVTGHSLAGGLAQAIHAGSGGEIAATTWNSAGTRDELADQYNIAGKIDENRIQAYRVRGEVVTYEQEKGRKASFAPDAKGRKFDLDPADPGMRKSDLSDAEREELHGMDNTIAALENQKSQDEGTLQRILAAPGLTGLA